MILRIFKVEIEPYLVSDFERDFATISVDSVEKFTGCISCEIGYPSKWNPFVYSLISLWENEDALIEFAGENWKQSIIPNAMLHYAKEHSVEHFILK